MVRENHGKVSSKTILSGPEEEVTYNRFSCFAVHSKMSQSTNAKSKPLEGLYTDTDPDNRSEIITDVTIRMPGKAGTMMMEVKVDPGVQPSCIHCINSRPCFLTYVGMDFQRRVCWTTPRTSSSPTVVETVRASSCHDSLIFMSTHKATTARCLSRHQATYGLPPSVWPL